jgi:hypothetical protein
MLKNVARPALIMTSYFFVAALILGYLCIPSQAQRNASASVNAPPEAATAQPTVAVSEPPSELGNNPPTPQQTKGTQGYLSTHEFVIALMVAGVSLIALSMQFFLLKKIPKLRAEDALRTFGVTLIIMGPLFLISFGFDSIQIAPAMGLFGTIAGYLLGRVGRRESETSE